MENEVNKNSEITKQFNNQLNGAAAEYAQAHLLPSVSLARAFKAGVEWLRRYQDTKKAMPKTGAELISNERKRQVEKEGFDEDHDQRETWQDLVRASQAYSLSSLGFFEEGRKSWPWDEGSFKPKDTEKDLIRSGALLAAAIDRYDKFFHEQV